jgi:hypothetical protein
MSQRLQYGVVWRRLDLPDCPSKEPIAELLQTSGTPYLDVEDYMARLCHVLELVSNRPKSSTLSGIVWPNNQNDIMGVDRNFGAIAKRQVAY